MNARQIICHAMVVAILVLIASSVAHAQESGVMDKYLDKYWGEKRQVKVIQKRLYQKDGRHELGLYGGFIPNDAFVQYYPVGLRWNYYFAEDIGIEINGAYIGANTTDLSDWLHDTYFTGKEVLAHIPLRYRWNVALEGIWSPIHGKLGIFTATLVHFDLFISVGVGLMGWDMITLEKGKVTEANLHDWNNVTGKLGLGLRLYLLDWLTVRVDFRQYFLALPSDDIAGMSGGLGHPSEITLGVYFFLN